MFETHLDGTYAWLGLAVVSVVTVGVAATLPASPPPDASGVAQTIDSVADSSYPATAEHGIAADELRVTPRSVELDDGNGIAWAALHGPKITPVTDKMADAGQSGPLAQVLGGVPPQLVFDDPAALAAAAADARSGDHHWSVSSGTVTVRHVQYEEVHVTLVG